MTKYQPEWIFNLSLQLAAAASLGMLVVALMIDVAPLTALGRSTLAFAVFATLGWVISLVWRMPEASPAPVEADPEAAHAPRESIKR